MCYLQFIWRGLRHLFLIRIEQVCTLLSPSLWLVLVCLPALSNTTYVYYNASFKTYSSPCFHFPVYAFYPYAT